MTTSACHDSESKPQLTAGSCVAVLWIFLFAGNAAAQSASADAVQLAISDCEHAKATAISKLVSLDLAARGLRVAAASEATHVRAQLQCSQDYASIVVGDDRRSAPLELELSLHDTPPEARTRFLALALAELIATSELEQPSPRAPPQRLQTDKSPLLRAALWLAGGGMLGYQPMLLAPELQLGAAVGFKRFSLQLDADFSWSQRHIAAAAVQTRVLSFALAPAWRLLDGTLAWDLAAGLRTSFAWLSAAPTRSDEAGRSLQGVLLAPLAQSTLGLRIAANWRVQLALEVNYLVKPLRGLASDGSTLIALRGVRAALLLGVRLTWDD